jgi:hypothetical protein
MSKRILGIFVALIAAGVFGCEASGNRSSFGDDKPDAGAEPAKAEPTEDASAPTFVLDAEPPGEASSCAPCAVTGPGTFCGIDVSITPFVTGGPFGGFQSVAGTGYQVPITITLSQPITWVSVKILDPDFPDYIRVYDASGTMTGQVQFVSDGSPNVLTDSTMGLGGSTIKKLELVNDPQDYVAYDDLQIVPAGCAPPLK